jgi:hypothetical protein
MVTKASDVFINCPFDTDFLPRFQALVFAVRACGFRVRCALEMDDGGETRIDKLYRIIDESRYSIHDLSRTELDPINRLPRFNMPLELGIFLGAKRFGGEDQKIKRCLILDVEQYRYQRFISDLAGMDIKAHGADVRMIVRIVRDWLVTVSRRQKLPSPDLILASYDGFVTALPTLVKEMGLDGGNLIFPDYERLVLAWTKQGDA